MIGAIELAGESSPIVSEIRVPRRRLAARARLAEWQIRILDRVPSKMSEWRILLNAH